MQQTFSPNTASTSQTTRYTFYACTMQEGMAQVRNLMGPNAVILSSRTVPHRQSPWQQVLEIIAEMRPTFQPASLSSSHERMVGGLDAQLTNIREVVVFPIIYPEMYARLGIPVPKGVLMHGPSGCGKTMIAHILAGECGAYFETVNGPELLSSNLGESESNLRSVFKRAAEKSSAILFFDEIDAIAASRESGSGAERRLVAQLLTLMDGTDNRGHIVVLAATNRPNDLDPALRRPGRFDREIKIPVPDRDGRLEIFQIHTRHMAVSPDVNLEDLASATHGYVGADIAHLCREAGMCAVRRVCPAGVPIHAGPEILVVQQNDFDTALKEARPSSLRKHSIETPDVHWDEIGGLDEVRREIQEAVILPIRKPELYKKMGIRPSRGLLLAGPSGTGKTLIARAAATSAV